MQIRKLFIFLAIVSIGITMGQPAGYCADVAKIGIVDFQRIIDNSEPGKAATNELKSQGRAMEADLKQRSDEINALEELLKRDSGVMSKEAREEKKWEYDRKLADAKALKKKYDRQIHDLQLTLVKEIRENLIGLIQEYGKKEGYLLIIENVGVIYSPQSVDITDTIIKLLNEQHHNKKKTS